MQTIESGLPALLPALRALSRADKLRAIQQLATDLAQEEGTIIEPGGIYPVFTPLNTFDAAEVMLKALQKNEATP